MGANLSNLQSRIFTGNPAEEPCLRSKRHCDGDADSDRSQLIPGLPNEISCQILARVPRSHHASLKTVCPEWNRLFSSPYIYDLRKQMGVTEEWVYVLLKDDSDMLIWYVLDPRTGLWKALPRMPEPEDESGMADLQPQPSDSAIKLIGKWIIRTFFSDRNNLKGCSVAALDGCLFVVGGCCRSVLNSVWRYDARADRWSTVGSLTTARAFCKTACLQNKLYAVGGVHLGGHEDIQPLQSAEVYNPATDRWSPVGTFCLARTDSLPALIPANVSKPLATTAMPYKGRLCVSETLQTRPFYHLEIAGQIYEPLSDTWMEMPRGLVEGWPKFQGGANMSSTVNGEMVALDPTTSLEGTRLKVYDSEKDKWKIICKKVPLMIDMIPYGFSCVMAGFKHKLYIASKDFDGTLRMLCGEFNNLSYCDGKDWKVVGTRRFHAMNLLACQVLDN